MVNIKTLAAMTGIAMAMSAVPAQAVVFATFAPRAADVQASSAYANIRWSNSGLNGSQGTSGTISTIVNNQVGSPTGSRVVSFSFLPGPLAAVVTNVDAVFTFTGASPQIATNSGTTLTQGNLSGTFSFLYSGPMITVGNNDYYTGANLLSGTFGNSAIIGTRGGNVGDMDADTSLGQTLTFTSDFLDFSGVTDSSFAFDLANIRSVLSTLGNPVPTTALRSFRTRASGSFGYEGELLVNGVPEPQTWGLMVVGFGMVGLQVRRRSRRAVAA